MSTFSLVTENFVSRHMEPMAVVSGQLKQILQQLLPLHLDSRYDWSHGAAIQPKLDLVHDHALPHKVLQVGMVMQEPQVGDGKLYSGCGQGGATEEEGLDISSV